MQGWTVINIALAYLALLFLFAWLGDKVRLGARARRLRPLLYSLSLAVYCTSWSFFGTVGQASTDPWSYFPIYLGPILVFTLAGPFIARLIEVAKREHITSIADFIAARYGKSQRLAVYITLIAIVGVLPYIALQLKAIVMGLNLVAPDVVGGDGRDAAEWPLWWPCCSPFSSCCSAPAISTPPSTSAGSWWPSPWSRWSSWWPLSWWGASRSG
jgi:hypothetical protein